MEDLKKAYNYTIRLLSKRDYSVHKLTAKLRIQNFDQDIIDQTISRLIEQKYLQEEQYAKSRVKGLLYRGYSSQFIIKKLAQEELKVDTDLIQEMQNDASLNQKDTITALIEKRLRGRSIPTDNEEKQKLKNKIMRFLISKGHSFSTIQDSISIYF